ncbi:alanine racemase [Desulfolucanica intricata]|uniref:alanine racemase n=1 Tax=Desulfolucanica intricata TaxID=1285191 RepID=UPI00082F300D|nr:alanine racemase [Desulfolucanica intricata]
MYKVPTWAEIDLGAIAHNIQELRRVTAPGAQFMAVVKANAYGHGSVEVARTALQNGAVSLAVARVSEGVILREAGIDRPILVLGFVPPGEMALAIEKELTLTVFNLQQAEILSGEAGRLGKQVKVHIKIETGMGRLGFEAGKATVSEILAVYKLSNLELEGIFTHFAKADSADKTYTLKQFERFREVLQELGQQGVDVPVKHAANSAALIDLPDTHLDLVRGGIAMYGLYPSEEVNKERVSLRPAMTLKTQVGHIKRVSADYSVSYGCTYVTKSPGTIATLPIGYGDGYTRLLSSRGEVLLHGLRAPVVGRVCMDQCMIDVTHIPDVKVGDEVVLWGSQGSAKIPAEEVAAKIGTINYELVCMVKNRVLRVYKNN